MSLILTKSFIRGPSPASIPSLSYLAIKTQSVIPCAIAHSAINAFAGIGICLYKGTPNPFIGPSPTGIIGGSVFILVGIYCYVKAGKINKPFEEELVSNK